jgi:hypothetical protein
MFGYHADNMIVLTDDQQKQMSQPTRSNILRAMHWLAKDARPNDSLFFHYSGTLSIPFFQSDDWIRRLQIPDHFLGHGGASAALDDSGQDEAIYPIDFRQEGHIIDDEMHRIMVRPLISGVRLTVIFDSSHSSTTLDLPYIYSTQGILKEPNLTRESGPGLLQAISSYSKGPIESGKSLIELFKETTLEDTQRGQKKLEEKVSPADVAVWCMPHKLETRDKSPLSVHLPSDVLDSVFEPDVE